MIIQLFIAMVNKLYFTYSMTLCYNKLHYEMENTMGCKLDLGTGALMCKPAVCEAQRVYFVVEKA